MGKNEIVNVLYGSQSTYGHCCGYCKMKGKYLTPKQMKHKECLRKQCNALDKLEHHPFWDKRAEKLASKNEHKFQERLMDKEFYSEMKSILSMIITENEADSILKTMIA